MLMRELIIIWFAYCPNRCRGGNEWKNINAEVSHAVWLSQTPTRLHGYPSSCLPSLNFSHLFCESMFPSEPEPSPVPQHVETQLDFFHKLGYSTAQVQAVKQQFGPNMDTDKLLGELVRVQAGQEAKQGPVTTMSVLVSRDAIQAADPSLQLPFPAVSPVNKEESSEDEEALRPIVIDGSNVAMRWETPSCNASAYKLQLLKCEDLIRIIRAFTAAFSWWIDELICREIHQNN